jgi:MFS family permease
MFGMRNRFAEKHRRGFANASIVAGMALGPAFGTLAGGIMMSRFGWRPVFLVVGLTSPLWLLPWLRWMPKGHRDSPSQLGLSALGMLQILEQRSAWGTCIGLFCINYLMYFLLTSLPFYLVHERHFSLAAMAKIAGWAYFLIAVATTSDPLHCLRKNFNPGSQDVYGHGTGGGWDLACCLRRQRASTLGNMSAVGGGVLGNQRFQYLGDYSNTCGTAGS